MIYVQVFIQSCIILLTLVSEIKKGYVTEDKLAAKYGASSYPSIVYFRKGHAALYPGKLDFSKIMRSKFYIFIRTSQPQSIYEIMLLWNI